MFKICLYGAFVGIMSELSLAIPPCVCKMSIGGGYSHRWGRNGEFCVTV